MSKKITVSPEFIKDFNLCMDYFQVSDEEIIFEKERVRNNYKEALLSYKKTAEMIELILRMNIKHDNRAI